MTQLLLAIHDDDLRCALSLLLQDTGFEVTSVPNGITAFARLVKSPQPLVVMLDTHLPERDVAEKLLDLASAGGWLGRHRYIVLSTTYPDEYAPALAFYLATMPVPTLTNPCDADAVLGAVGRAAATLTSAPDIEREAMPVALASAS